MRVSPDVQVAKNEANSGPANRRGCARRHGAGRTSVAQPPSAVEFREPRPRAGSATSPSGNPETPDDVTTNTSAGRAQLCETNPIWPGDKDGREPARRSVQPLWSQSCKTKPICPWRAGMDDGTIVRNEPNFRRAETPPPFHYSIVPAFRSLLCTYHNNRDAGVLTEQTWAVYCPAIPSGSFQERS